MITTLIFESTTIYNTAKFASGSIEFLIECKQNYIKIILIENKISELIGKSNSDFHDLFDFVICPNSISQKFPQPDLLLDAIIQSDSLPQDSIVFANTPEATLASSAAGISCFEMNAKENLTLIDYKYENFEDISVSLLIETITCINWINGIVE